MSTATLVFRFKVGGVATNASSVVLNNFRRADNNDIMAADDTPMTQAGAVGTYVYPFTPPAAHLTYNWTAEATYNGETYSFTQATTDESNAAVVSDGYYASYSDLILWLGNENIEMLSDVDQLDQINANRVSQALAEGDRTIDLALRTAGYSYPLDTNNPYHTTMTDIALRYAAHWMYTAHSSRIDDEQMRNNAFVKVNGWKKSADRELQMLLMQARDLSRSSSAPIYPTGV